MINVQVTTPRGRIINEDCKFVLVRGSDGERGYLPNHTPVMMNIENGYVRLDGMLDSTFVAINSAVMDLKNNKMTIIGEYHQQPSHSSYVEFHLLKWPVR